MPRDNKAVFTKNSYNCPKCTTFSGNLLQVKLHLKVTHKSFLNTTVKIAECCILCNKQFETKREIKKHVKRDHK